MKSSFLNNKHDICKRLVDELLKEYPYVSLLGKDIDGITIRVSTFNSRISDSFEAQRGFVVRVYNNTSFSEYAFSNIDETNFDSLIKDIKENVKLSDNLLNDQIKINIPEEEILKKDFYRDIEDKELSINEIVDKLKSFKDKAHSLSEKVVNAIFGFDRYNVSSMFISKNKDLTQTFTWMLSIGRVVAREDENIKDIYNVSAHNSYIKCLDEMENNISDMVNTVNELLHSSLIEPGIYDCITTPSITGLIAHEAFGHGVELDMFVKNRAKAKEYVNDYVASPLITMHDGAGSCLSQASYFFDDDGVLAHDTIVIKDGILKTGISDLTSSLELGMEASGNGRRQNPFRKSYSRMTNTFFEAGSDNLADMIKSIKHGYMLYQMDNGMEDPKNWNIQCTCAYAKEIKDGKFTGKIVAPVVMSGYVLDLLKSITMVSKEFEMHGSGHCGKGHKEWVPVSDGGPYLKCKCKLG